MNEDYIPFELAKKLNEKDFYEYSPCHYRNGKIYPNSRCVHGSSEYIDHDIRVDYEDLLRRGEDAAPTISQVLKWLRNEKKIFINVDVRTNLEWYYEVWNINEKLSVLGNVPFNNSESYEEAAIAGIEYVLDNLI